MSNWYEKPGAGWKMRLGGLMAIGIALLAGTTMYHRLQMAPYHQPTAVDMLLGIVAFFAMSVGSALATLGQHLFDSVEIASPWEQFYPPSFKRENHRQSHQLELDGDL